MWDVVRQGAHWRGVSVASDILATAAGGVAGSYGALSHVETYKKSTLFASAISQDFGLNDAYAVLSPPPPHVVGRESLQPCVLCLGLFEDRNARVGVFPEGAEVLVGGLGLTLIPRQCECPA